MVEILLQVIALRIQGFLCREINQVYGWPKGTAYRMLRLSATKRLMELYIAG